MSQSNTLTVQILDKEYCINCPDDERANLESAARYLDGKMREIRSSGKVIGADRVAVMAALNITHDLLHRKERLDQESSSTRERVRELLDRVDRALANTASIARTTSAPTWKAPPVTWTARCARSAPAAKSSAPTGLP